MTRFNSGMANSYTLFHPDHSSRIPSFQSAPPVGGLCVCALFYQHVHIWLCKFFTVSRCARASAVHPFSGRRGKCVFRKSSSGQSASYLPIVLHFPMEACSKCSHNSAKILTECAWRGVRWDGRPRWLSATGFPV